MNNEWTPEVGQKYQHHSGRVYEVTGFANQATEYPDKFPVTVIYKNVDNGTEWARALDDWRQKFRPIKSEADKLRDEQIKQLRQEILNKWNVVGLDCPIKEWELADFLYVQGARMTRELTDYVIGRIVVEANHEPDVIAKMAVAYVMGEEI